MMIKGCLNWRLVGWLIAGLWLFGGRLYGQELDAVVAEEDTFILVPKNLKWGIHLGGVYASYFNKFSPSGGLVLSWHRNRVGVQMELNYSKIFDEFDHEWTFFRQGVKLGDAMEHVDYETQTLELPVLLVFGKKRTHKAGFNFLLGPALRYGLAENRDKTNTSYYVDGRVEVQKKSEDLTVFKDDDYSLVIMSSSVGLTYGKETFCAGLRIEEAFLGDGRWLPGFRLYGMMRFPKDW